MLPNPNLPRVMSHDFSSVPHADIPRSIFRLDHTWTGAFDSGYLIPILCDEVVPGTTLDLKLTSIARLATPLVPFMDTLEVEYYFFSCPCRLLWSNFKRFMGERDPDPDSSIDYTVPVVSSAGHAVGSLLDHMGIPPGITKNVNAWWTRCYNRVFNDWFRSQDLQDSVQNDTGDGPDTIGNYVLLRKCKRADYFTTCLPDAQKGDAVQMPLGSRADIVGIGKQNQTFTEGAQTVYQSGDSASSSFSNAALMDNSTANRTWFFEGTAASGGYPDIYADLSGATAASINDMREAIQTQRLLERDQRSGSRYVELIQSHFGVTDPQHAILQRPEYLGGGRAPIIVTPIPNTSDTATQNQGDLAAVGLQSAQNIGFTKSFTEHSIILGLACVVHGKQRYQQGVSRQWFRQTRYDYYLPVFANLGEQEVLTREIFCDGSANDDIVFGYQERWAEMRMRNSHITGILRSDAAGAIDEYHLAIDFASYPSLNSSFIQENPPIARVVAVPSEPEIIMDVFYDYTATLPLPAFSVPGQMDHF